MAKLSKIDLVARNIKSLKIQGANSIALAGSRALAEMISYSRTDDTHKIMSELKKGAKKLIRARETEPALRNAINYIIYNDTKKTYYDNDIQRFVFQIKKNAKFVEDHFILTKKKISDIGSKKIHNGMNIFTHCHSSSVVSILLNAKKHKRKFAVYNTETRPKFQGRITATELARAKIKVFHSIDSAVRSSLKKSDLFLFGADAIQSDGKIINKIGTELFLEVAEKYDVPAYCCTNSWKIDPMTILGNDEPMENRNANEVWEKRPKGVKILNPAFEIIEPELVCGVISELGIYKPALFVREVKDKYPALF